MQALGQSALRRPFAKDLNSYNVTTQAVKGVWSFRRPTWISQEMASLHLIGPVIRALTTGAAKECDRPGV